MLTKKEANKLRGLISRKVKCERALWALNSDTRHGCNFERLRAGILADLKAADEALFGAIRKLTEGYGAVRAANLPDGIPEDLE